MLDDLLMTDWWLIDVFCWQLLMNDWWFIDDWCLIGNLFKYDWLKIKGGFIDEWLMTD